MNDHNISSACGDDGILIARIDMPGRSMNVFSMAMMDSLEQLLSTVEEDRSIRAVVLTSGKPAFLAGADLEMIRTFTEAAISSAPAQLHQLCGRLGRLFRRLEKSSKPCVAAINGLALGGGLELALACHARVAGDEPGVQLGMPEVRLGLLPGAGGTQRLPRMIGMTEAMKLLLLGEPITSRRALELQLVDEVSAPSSLIESARRRALALLDAPVCAPWDRPQAVFSEAPFDFARSDECEAIFEATGVSAHQVAHYPAYKAILASVIGGWNKPFDDALHWEMTCFVELIRNPVAGNMVRALFLNRHRAAKLGLLGPESKLAQGANALLPRLQTAKRQALELGCTESEVLLAISLAAIHVWSEGAITEPNLADAAAVVDGVSPAYSGGPYTYAVQCGPTDLSARAALCREKAGAQLRGRLFATPPGFDEFLNAPHSAVLR